MLTKKTIPAAAVAWALFTCSVTLLRAHEGAEGHVHALASNVRTVVAQPATEGPLRVSLVASALKGGSPQWGLRIDNVGQNPVHVAADVRLLKLVVKEPAGSTGKRRAKRKTTVCDGPRDFGLRRAYPSGRGLTLKPGFSYVERFDPRLLCFGAKGRALTAGAEVHASYGFATRRAWGRSKTVRPPFVTSWTDEAGKKHRAGRLELGTIVVGAPKPVALEGFPAPRPGLVAPSFAKAKQVAAAGKAKRNHGAAGLTLTTLRYADAGRRRDLRLSVQAHNVGDAPLLVALRARQLAFAIADRHQVHRCGRPGRHAVPPDLLRTLPESKHVHVALRLAEVCPNVTFARPGLYRARPSMYAVEAADESRPKLVRQRVTVHDPGRVGGTHHEGDDSTLIRVRLGSASLYEAPPSAVATATLADL